MNRDNETRRVDWDDIWVPAGAGTEGRGPIAMESCRDILFVSFIAGQGDLAEMVGEEYLDSGAGRVRDSLKRSEERYETVTPWLANEHKRPA